MLLKGKEDCRKGQEIMHKQNRMTDKDGENIKRNQKEILDLKNKKIEVKNSLKVLKDRL